MGEVLLRRDQPPPHLFIISQGRVKLVIEQQKSVNAKPSIYTKRLIPPQVGFKYQH